MGDLRRGPRGSEGPSVVRVALVDTDVLSLQLEDRPGADRFSPLMPARLALAFVTAAELRFGAAKANWGDRRLAQLEKALDDVVIIHSDERLVRTYALLRAAAVRLGHPLGHRANANDLWIAACAVRHGLPLITGNQRHFDGLPWLRLLIPDGVR